MKSSNAHLIVVVVMILEPFSSFISKNLISRVDIAPAIFLWSVCSLFWSFLILAFQRKISAIIPLIREKPVDITLIIVFACLGWSTWFLALKHETIAVVNTVINSYVIFSLLLGYLFFNERFSRIEWLGVICTIVGVFVLIYQPFTYSLGVFFGLLNAVFYSIQYMLVKKIINNTDSFTLSVTRTAGIAMIAGVALFFVNQNNMIVFWDWTTIALALSGAMVAILISLLVYTALRHMDYSRFSIIKLWQPVILVLLSIFIFQEHITLRAAAGISAMCLGALLMSANSFKAQFGFRKN